MKKVICIILINIIILSSYGIIVSSTGLEITEKTIHLSFKKPIILYDDQFVSVNIPGISTYIIKQGYPLIPSQVKVFHLPPGSKILSVKVDMEGMHEEYIDQKIIPSPSAYIIGEGTSSYMNQINYNFSIYPENWYIYNLSTGIYKGRLYLFVTVDLYPIRYIPNENKILVVDSMDVNIEYKPPIKQESISDYSFLIISPVEFVGELQPLVNHKTSRGVSTKLVTLDEIYNSIYFPVQGRDKPEKIKYFIKNAIENWGTTFVMLVGDINHFPARETHIEVSNNDREIFVSDLYYADIYNTTGGFSSWDTNNNDMFAEYNWDDQTDDMDLHPDVYLGRLACVDVDQVSGVVNKIIQYENNKAYTQDWFTNIITAGGDSFEEKSGVNEGEIVNEAVINIMDGFIPNKIWDSNGRLSGYSPSGVSEIESAFDEGAGFVDFSGHGNPTTWATHRHNTSIWIPTPSGGLFSSKISSFHNGGKLPIVITGACSVGKYNVNSNCFSWSFVANPYGGGIASMGATALGYAYIGKYVTSGLVEGMVLDMFRAYHDGAFTFGEIWVDGLNKYIRGHLDAGDYKTILEWQPFGDPTLIIAEKSNPPEKPTLTGPPQGKTGKEYTFDATSTDPDGDKIYYLFDWGDGTTSGWLGPSISGGNIHASHTWGKRGDYNIRVKVKDEHGVLGPWSDYLTISMSKSKAIYDTIHHLNIDQWRLIRNLLFRYLFYSIPHPSLTENLLL